MWISVAFKHLDILSDRVVQICWLSHRKPTEMQGREPSY